ncbi:MAG: amidohydrolase [Clostridia bacterium]|nr:amidohydrolase [Clostridia bacterium]
MQKETLIQEARSLEQRCIEDRRYLHAHAETGFDLHETYAYIWKQLTEMGIEPMKCGRCGISCTIGKPGRTFLLRADMDALPIREETNHPFACQTGSMHACGHDMHAAMLLTAARLLKKHENALPGTVKLMFQPAEEPLEGARDMIDAGVLENPRVDAALMFHVMTAQTIPVGTVIISAPGVSAPAAGTFSIHVQGKGSHGAMPHTGVDPISVAAHILIALQEINAREIAPSDHAALTICSLQAGSTANVIPDTALLRGNFRAFADDTFEFIRQRVEEIATATAQVFRAEAQVEFHAHAPTLINNAELVALAEKQLTALLGSDKVFNAAKLAGSSASRSSGSEDFAAVSHRVPSLMLALAAGHPDEGYVHPLHHPGADFDERALVTGAAAYAWLAMQWLEENK